MKNLIAMILMQNCVVDIAEYIYMDSEMDHTEVYKLYDKIEGLM